MVEGGAFSIFDFSFSIFHFPFFIFHFSFFIFFADGSFNWHPNKK